MKQVVTRFVIKITFSRNHTPQKPTAVTVGSLPSPTPLLVASTTASATFVPLGKMFFIVPHIESTVVVQIGNRSIEERCQLVTRLRARS